MVGLDFLAPVKGTWDNTAYKDVTSNRLLPTLWQHMSVMIRCSQTFCHTPCIYYLLCISLGVRSTSAVFIYYFQEYWSGSTAHGSLLLLLLTQASYYNETKKYTLYFQNLTTSKNMWQDMTKQNSKKNPWLWFTDILRMYLQVIIFKFNTILISTTFWKGHLGLIVDNK